MLTSFDLDDILPKLGWIRTEGRGEEKKTREYSKADNTVYVKQKVKKLNNSRTSIKTLPLVIPPSFISKIDQILLIPGVSRNKSNDKFYHNSTMRLYPDRMNNGKNKTKYGLDIGIDNYDALSALLEFLSGTKLNDIAKDIADIYDQSSSKTEKETLIKSRLGQGKFRDGLAKIHNSQCQLSYVDKLDLLRASHIKPWSKCDNDAERLDSDNGLLLAIQYDLLFDKGYISFQDDGSILISDIITNAERHIFQLNDNMKITMQSPKQKAYMKYHRERIFF